MNIILNNPRWQELVKKIQQMTLMDDVFFNSFMNENFDAMEYILNIIMNKTDLKVRRIQTQHCVPNLYGRSVRFDVFAIDQYGREYNFEVQNANDGAEPKRARYNSDMLDFRKLNAGDGFDKLPETYVIFITAKDVLGYGLPIYHIERCIMKVGKQFYDKAHIIYVNGENTDDSPLGRLMQDFKQSDADKMQSKLLSDRMKYLKSTDEEVTKMCNIVEEYSAKRFDEGVRVGERRGERRGERKGKHKMILQNIKSLMQNKHFSATEAMKALSIDKAQHSRYLALL